MKLFEKQRFCLNVMGHNFNNLKQKSLGKYYAARVMFIASTNIWVLWFTFTAFPDIQSVASSLSMSLTNILGIAKIAAFLAKINDYKDFIAELESLNESEFIKVHDRKKRILNANDSTSKFMRYYYYSVMTSGIYFIISPLPKMLMQAIFDGKVELKLPFLMKFPFDMENILNFIVAYIYGALVVFIICYYLAAIDGLFIGFSLNLRAHYKVLQDALMENNFEGNIKDICQDLRLYEKYHNKLLEISENLADLYRPVIFAQFTLISLEVCLIVQQIQSNKKNMAIIFPYVSLLATKLSELLIYCWGGEIVMQESQQVDQAIQCSKWYKLKPKQRRALCLMMLRSQRPVVMEAGVYTATLESFMVLVQTASSYLTFMESFE